MQYIIMCGGKYNQFNRPKQLSVVNGEVLLERTIRLLEENGVKNVLISTNNPDFDYLDKYILKYDNGFETTGYKTLKGYWLDAFYPLKEPACYIFGDVYFSEEAIKRIVEAETNDTLFFASKKINRKDYFKNWEEPFAFKVANQKRFRECIDYCKKERDLGHTNREPIAWELYRALNDYPLNIHKIGTGFVAIDDYTTDIDSKDDICKLEEILKNIDKKATMC